VSSLVGHRVRKGLNLQLTLLSSYFQVFGQILIQTKTETVPTQALVLCVRAAAEAEISYLQCNFLNLVK
jgi:hypothetical protein